MAIYQHKAWHIIDETCQEEAMIVSDFCNSKEQDKLDHERDVYITGLFFHLWTPIAKATLGFKGGDELKSVLVNEYFPENKD